MNQPGLPPHSPVISVAWSLLRRAPGPATVEALSPAAGRRLSGWINRADATALGWRL